MRRTLTLLVAAVVGLLLFHFAWPQVLAGGAEYIVVSGASMEPTYHTGDLVVVRRTADYGAGDVIAFRTEQGKVIHRIVGGDAIDGYITRGDNKDAEDPWQPTPAQIVGKTWLHVPRAGGWIKAARDVINPEFALGIGGALLLTDTQRRRRRRRDASFDRRYAARLHRRADSETTSMRHLLPHDWPRHRRGAAVVTAVALVAAVALVPTAWSAWTTSPTETVSLEGAEYAHTTAFSYTAVAREQSLVYPDGTVGPVAPAEEELRRETPPAEEAADAPFAAASDDDEPAGTPTPQALYTALIERLDVTVDYTIDTEQRVDDLAGRAEVALRLETPDGWNETLPVAAAKPVEGLPASLTVPIDIGAVTQRMTDVAEVSGVSLASFDAVVVADVDVTGEVGGRTIDDQVTAELPVTIGASLIEPSPQLAVVEPRSSNEVTQRGNAVLLLGMTVSVDTARTVTAIALPLLLLLAAGAAYHAWGKDEPTRIRLLHRSTLVHVDPDAREVGRPVPVRSITELVRLAKQDQRMVLHQRTEEGGHRYFVPDGGLTYEYRLRPEPADGRSAADPESIHSAPPPPVGPGAKEPGHVGADLRAAPTLTSNGVAPSD